MSGRRPLDRRQAVGDDRLLHVTDAMFVTVAAALVFWPVLNNQFVNWDDPDVLVNNPHLGQPGIAAWAFTTTLMGHYQPLAWLFWSRLDSIFGLTPAAFHGLSLAGHIVNTLLVYVVAARLIAGRLTPDQRRIAATVCALMFSLHPLHVETVAWASAFPYVLSLTALLLAFLTYVNEHVAASLVCYAVSLLARANAIAFPVALLLVDIFPLDRVRHTRLQRLVIEKVPFVVLAVAAVFAESHAREVATLQEVGAGARLTLAATAPFVYLGRLLLPLRLSPLHPLPISPAIEVVPLLAGAAGLAAITVAVWLLRRRYPMLIVAWIAYLALLAPVAGLTPSGLQATADRYVYLPGVVVSIVIGIAVAALFRPGRGRQFAVVAAGLVILSALGAQARRQTQYWSDSIALWTRAADLDPRNDVASYNLAIALAEAGREDEAIRRYEQTLQLVPDHDLARRNLAAIRAIRTERDGDRLAAAGRLDEAAAAYSQAVALDGKRLHARAARGVILMRRGRIDEASADLRMAFDGGVNDPEVPNALAFALMQSRRPEEAIAVLKRAVAGHPDDVNLAHNLARILATAPDPRVRDGPLALRLALEVRDRTHGRDPRALDTLAAAYAAAGRLEDARATANEAEAIAREEGDSKMAEEISARARRYR